MIGKKRKIAQNPNLNEELEEQMQLLDKKPKLEEPKEREAAESAESDNVTKENKIVSDR